MLKPTKKNAQAVVRRRVAPLLKIDNGLVEIVRVRRKERTVEVRFGGAYRGSPCRETLVHCVIEPIFREELSDIQNVECVD